MAVNRHSTPEMTNTQVTLLQLDNYGPWTVTPEPRREMNLQALQSRLFADVARFVGSRDGYVFPVRYDNMIAVTNGISPDEFETLQQMIRDSYPVTVSIGLGNDPSPRAALADATARLQEAGSAQSSTRAEVFGGDLLPAEDRSESDVYVAHFDVVDATEKYTDQLNAFDSFTIIEETYHVLRDYLYDVHGALSFFIGGDNAIAVCPSLTENELAAGIEHVRTNASVDVRVGTGLGGTACEAGILAKEALERCRHRETSIERVTRAELR